ARPSRRTQERWRHRWQCRSRYRGVEIARDRRHSYCKCPCCHRPAAERGRGQCRNLDPAAIRSRDRLPGARGVVAGAMRLALVIGVLVTLPAAATDSRREAAENLIRAMRADEQVAQLVERYVRDACRDGGCRVDLTKCLATIDH